MSGRPIICPHCGYKHWAPYLVSDEVRKTDAYYTGVCDRCSKNMKDKPEDDGYETVSINGRMVRRLKNANSQK